MMKSGLFIGALFLSLMAHPAQSAEVKGPAAVVDGDTLEVGGRQIRLLGIDSFEGAQKLPLSTGGTDFVGRGAAMMLRSLITTANITCKLSDVSDRRGLPLATCYSNEVNLAREMVASGISFAARTHQSPYLEIEARARADKKGFWRDTIETPWKFRDRRIQEASKAAPNSCPFKGVILRGRKTLIAPWSPWYSEAKVKQSKGDRWYCHEKQAVADGWYEPLWLIESVVSGVYNPGN